MWELVIAIAISMPNSNNIKVEVMPDKNTCFEVLDSFKYNSVYSASTTYPGQSFVYCRPKEVK